MYPNNKRINILYRLSFSSLLITLMLWLQRVPGWLKWKSLWQALAQRTAHFRLQWLNQVPWSLLAVVVSEASTVTIPEVPVTTSALTESVAGLVSAPSEMAPASTDIVRTIIERGSGSGSTELAPTMDIMKDLTHQMVQQFFTSMRSRVELVLFGRSSFEFAWMFLENQIENIRHTGSSEQARAYLTLVEQLGICLKELRPGEG